MSCMECSGKDSIKGSLCISWHCVSSKTGHDVELTVYSIGFIGTMFEAKTSQEAATETTFSQGTSIQVQVSHSETFTILDALKIAKVQALKIYAIFSQNMFLKTRNLP